MNFYCTFIARVTEISAWVRNSFALFTVFGIIRCTSLVNNQDPSSSSPVEVTELSRDKETIISDDRKEATVK